jgi:hypothetical protein
MTSLAEAYHGARNESLRRLYLGTGLFAAGAMFAVVAIVVASTGVLRPLGFGVYEAREIAGILAGLGVPAVFVGIFTVLPASDRERAVAAVGAAIALLGVVLFWSTYPEQWITATQNHLTLPVTTVYFVGVLTTFWSLFTAVVNFKTRNNPGGTITIERSVNGETQLVEVPVSELEGSTLADVGGVGVVGDVDRESVMAGGGPEVEDDGVIVHSEGTPSRGSSTPASDGGTQTQGQAPAAPSERAPAHASNPDRYCGNCSHFDYVNVEGDIQPYCGHHDELMDDMEPCDAWVPNAYR